MKKLFITIGLAALAVSSQAQGLVNFFNANATATWLETAQHVPISVAPATLGGFRYELFSASAGTAADVGFVSSGLIATNTGTVGRFNGGSNVGIPGRALGGTAAILVRGWSSNLGQTWSEAFAASQVPGATGYIGSSPIAPNFFLGGDPGTGLIPTSPVFGGASGIVPVSGTVGFYLTQLAVPEPSSMALAGIGAAALMIFRRRK